jgi:hypothetical protein
MALLAGWCIIASGGGTCFDFRFVFIDQCRLRENPSFAPVRAAWVVRTLPASTKALITANVQCGVRFSIGEV